ncbi:MAG: M3 family oligoendopeptidase [Oscillospiraceae bacterium]
MHFKDMTYQRITYEEVKADYETLFQDLKAVSDEEDCRAVLRKRYELFEKMTPMDLCYVRHDMDLNDPFYAAEQRYYDEIGPRIGELSNQFDRLLLVSPLRSCFEQLMGSFAFSLIKTGQESFDSRLISLQQEENSIIGRYCQFAANGKVEYGGKLLSRENLAREQQSPDREVRRRVYRAVNASWEAQRAGLEDFFDALVQNRDRQAKTVGYRDFVQLSYLRMNRIGYSPEDVKAFREQVKKYVVPVAAALNERRRKRLGLEKLYPYDNGTYFLEGNPIPLGDDAFCLEMTRRMFEIISPETKEYIDFMLDNGLYDVTVRDGKQTGGYCTQFEAYHSPFIFANFDGTSENAYIMSHEGGHGFYFYRKRNEEIRERGWYTSEMAETHAMSMEFFAAPYMELFFGDRAEDYRRMHLEKAIALIVYECQQDEFQQIIYEQPQLTKQQRNELWARLEGEYFPYREYTEEERDQLGSRWQRIRHVFLWPFYAIDYALAQVCALEYCRRMHEDPEEAWKSYLAFCNASGNMNFLESLRAAGLESPFEADCLRNLMGWLQTQL